MTSQRPLLPSTASCSKVHCVDHEIDGTLTAIPQRPHNPTFGDILTYHGGPTTLPHSAVHTWLPGFSGARMM